MPIHNCLRCSITLWARGALVCLQINRRPTEHCSGQIWRGVVSDVILIPSLFLHVLENCHVAPVDCDMVLHRNLFVICWARWFQILQIICGYFSILENLPVRANGFSWRGVVSDVILIPTLFLQVRETRAIPPVDCDMVLHRNSIVICWARWFQILQIICGYFSILENLPVRANGFRF